MLIKAGATGAGNGVTAALGPGMCVTTSYDHYKHNARCLVARAYRLAEDYWEIEFGEVDIKK